MALGGGSFAAMNKVLPGAYINFASAQEASVELSERGTAAIALRLTCSPEQTLFKVTRAAAASDCRRYFGFGWNDPEMLPVREIFRHAHTVYFYNLRRGGTRASCAYCTVKNPGEGGNNYSVAVKKNGTKYDVALLFGGTEVETHYGVANLGAVMSDYVVWSLSNIGTICTEDTETLYLQGGEDGTNGTDAYGKFLTELERFGVNAVCITSSDAEVQRDAVDWCRRMRDERGRKLQIVLPQIDGYSPCYEGAIVADDTSALSDSTEELALEWQIGLFYNKTGADYIYKYNGKPASVRAAGKILRGNRKSMQVSVTGEGTYKMGIARFNSGGTCIGYTSYKLTKDNSPRIIPMNGCHSFKLGLWMYNTSDRAEITDAEAFAEAAGFSAALRSAEAVITGDGTAANAASVMTPWVTGVAAGMAVNESATNLRYDGELTIGTDETQETLEELAQAGRFVFHIVDGVPRVLRDVNSLTEYDSAKSEDFSANQTIRVLDQVANDIASLFGGRYIGRVPNDAAGRMSLWNDIVKHHRKLERIRAIEAFSENDIEILPGENKRSIIVREAITPVNAMEQLYMTVFVQ